MHISWIAFLSVALGGAVGAIARYSVTLLLQRGGGSIQLGTLTSNLIGCFVMGILAQLAADTEWFNAEGLFPGHYRLLFVAGFCGSFTTLSALIFELSEMFQSHHIVATTVYLVSSVVGGFVCLYLGMMLLRT